MRVDPMTEPGDAIAIVGIGGLFAASDSPDQLWSIVLDGIDATSEVPARRWLIDPAEAFDRADRPGGPRLHDPRWIRGRSPLRPGRDRPGSRLARTAGPGLPPGPRRGEPGVARCANGTGRSRPRRRGVRQHRAADRDGLGPLARGSRWLPSKSGWACPTPATERDRAVERIPGRPAGRRGRDRAGIGRRGLHARRRLRLVALCPQAGRRRAAVRTGRCHDQRRGVAPRCALYPDGVLAASGALAPRPGRSARPSRRRAHRRRRGRDVRPQAAGRCLESRGPHLWDRGRDRPVQRRPRRPARSQIPRGSSGPCGWPTSRRAGAPATWT